MFSFECANPFILVIFQLLSRGVVVMEFSFSPPQSSSRSHTCQFPVTYNMMPGVQVLVSYVRPDGEIVADYLKLTVSTELEHQVCAGWSVTHTGN